MYIGCINVTETKCPIVFKKFQKVKFFGNFGPLIEHSPHWINFTIIIFISEKVDIINAYIKFGTKLFHLTREKKGKSKKGHRKNEKKGEFESLVFMRGYPNRALTPIQIVQ
jgi:hypothetical protein